MAHGDMEMVPYFISERITTIEKQFLCIVTWLAGFTVYDIGQDGRTQIFAWVLTHTLWIIIFSILRPDLTARSACADPCFCVASHEVQWDCALFQYLKTLFQCLEFFFLWTISNQGVHICLGSDCTKKKLLIYLLENRVTSLLYFSTGFFLVSCKPVAK